MNPLSNPLQIEEPFYWGVATSAHQVEGDNRASDWWAWEEAGHVDGGARSGRASDHKTLFKEDLALAKSLGVNSYRFSIEWARLEPREGEWSQEAVDWYRELIAECERLALVPMVTLLHFTLPQWLAEKGGLCSTNFVEYFLRFAKKVSAEYGDRLPLWCTLNEPMVLVAGSYLGKFMPPARYAPREAAVACANLLRAHTQTYDFLRDTLTNRTGPFRHVPLQVGYAHNMIDFKPERKYHPAEMVLAQVVNRLYNFAWIEATLGKKQKFSMPFLLPNVAVVKEALGKVRADFIGINYYTRAYLQWRPRAKDENQLERLPVGLSFARRREPVSDLGWSVRPQGLAKLLKKVKPYGRPIFITENGMADREDKLRPDYLTRHLAVISSAIEEGLDIRGYYHWSLIDNFEWVKGFWPRFGLFSVDYETMKRTPTRSSVLYADWIRAHTGRIARAER